MLPIKFNVIIPTRERADTLYHSLRTVIAQDYENLNIIVSDNYSKDNTRDVVGSFSDTRIKYINTGRRLSMSHNWEYALNHVKDGWVMFLGDDDGLYPWALQTLNQLIQKYNVDAIWSNIGSFQWPGHFADSWGGRLSIPLTTSVILKQSRSEIERVFSRGLLNTGLPWLYLGGTASINLINRARDQHGRFFCSQIPDIYSAVALSFATEKYLAIKTPIAVNGTSKHSNGNAWLRSTGDKEEKPSLLFQSEQNIPFHESLIYGKSFQVILYECYLQSWHIHHGALGISLNDQLQLAIKVASSSQLKNIQKQCHMIAMKNGLSFTNKGMVWPYKLLRISSVIRSEFWSVMIDPTRLKVLNVYDAVIASAHIYQFMTSGFYGRISCLLIGFIRRTILKIKKLIITASGG